MGEKFSLKILVLSCVEKNLAIVTRASLRLAIQIYLLAVEKENKLTRNNTQGFKFLLDSKLLVNIIQNLNRALQLLEIYAPLTSLVFPLIL